MAPYLSIYNQCKEKVLPHAIIIALFYAIIVVFFAPIFVEGKRLFQGDIPHHEGIAKQLIDYRKQTGEEPLWAQAVFSGMPAYLIDMHYNEPCADILKKILGGFLPTDIGYIMAAMLSAYICLCALGVSRYIAAASGIAYGLSTFTLISLAIGHDGKVAAMAYLPLVMAGIHIAYQINPWWGSLLTTFALTLEIAATHPQINYYLLIIIIVYTINQAFHAFYSKRFKQFLRTSTVLFFAGLLAITANLGRIWSIYEYGKYSVRNGSELNQEDPAAQEGLDKKHAFYWSLGKGETMTLLVPYFYGGSNNESLPATGYTGKALRAQGIDQSTQKHFLQRAPLYYGEQPFTAGPMYLGSVVIFLCLMGCWIVDKKQLYWLLTIIILAIFWSWGSHFATFNDFVYYYLPGYKRFRSVTMAIVMAQLGTVILAGLTLETMRKKKDTSICKKPLLFTTKSLVFLLVICLLLSPWGNYHAIQDIHLPFWLAEALAKDRQYLLQLDTIRTLLLTMMTALAIWAYGAKKINGNQLIVLSLLLITFDFYAVGKRYVPETSYQHQHQIDFNEQTPALSYVLQDSSWGYRVLHLDRPFADGRTAYYHLAVGGYHGAKLSRYQDLIANGLLQEYKQLNHKYETEEPWPATPLLNMLNTRYFIYSDAQEAVVKNDNALGSAWLAKYIHSVIGPQAEINALHEVDLASVAIIDTLKFPSAAAWQEKVLGQGTIHLIQYTPPLVTYAADLDADGLAVFSEIYYKKGWHAWIDHRPVVPLRVNYVLRGLAVPRGKHTITFQFKPQAYLVGNRIMGITHYLLLAIFCIFVGRWLLKNNFQ